MDSLTASTAPCPMLRTKYSSKSPGRAAPMSFPSASAALFTMLGTECAYNLFCTMPSVMHATSVLPSVMHATPV